MSPVNKAIWFVESNLTAPITLDDVAAHCGVSPFHVTRAFAQVTGRSLMRYWRERRLTLAARTLAAGAPDILAVALDAGYGSHEAFTRAFRSQFDLTPEDVRALGTTASLNLVEPIQMTDTDTVTLDPPEMRTLTRLLIIAGLTQRYTAEERGNLPAQWVRFQPYMGAMANAAGTDAYGVCTNTDRDGGMDYLSGMEVTGTSGLDKDLHVLRIAPRTYAVFRHRGHISGIGRTWGAIWSRGLQDAGLRVADAPLIELYTATFDPFSGMGTVEIMIPVVTT